MVNGMQYRSAIIANVYRKSLRLSNAARQQSNVGEMVNHMSIDAQVDRSPVTTLHIVRNLWS